MFDPAEIRTAPFTAATERARLALLNAQLAYAAARSPYYREHLAEAPAKLESFSDLTALPFTDAETLLQEERRMVCVPAGEIARIVSLTTSGSTGAAKRLYFTRSDLRRTVHFFAEGMAWMCAPGDVCAVLMPCTAPDGIGDLLCRALTAIGVRPLPIGIPVDTVAAEDALRAAAPQVLVGFPWHVRLLALRCPSLRPRAVLLSGDYVPSALCACIERQWHCTVLSHFGMTETGYGCAVQHPAGQTLYLRRDELLAEVIDPKTGIPQPAGTAGELVLTTLRREAMPLLRYRTGDLAVLTPEGDLARVDGRRSVFPEEYRLQEALSPLLWLWDFRSDPVSLTADLAPDAPSDAAARLAALAPGRKILTQTVSADDAAPAFSGKRFTQK